MSGPRPDRTGPATSAALDVGLGVGTAAWYALPDVVESRAARGAVKAAVLVGGAALVALRARSVVASDVEPLDVGRAVQPRADFVVADVAEAAGRAGDPRAASAGTSRRTASAVVAATLTASLAGTLLLDRGMNRTAGWLRRRGVGRPYAVIGATVGVATVLSRPSRSLEA